MNIDFLIPNSCWNGSLYFRFVAQEGKSTNSLKGVSSRMFAKEFGRIHRWFYKGVLGSPSYFAGSVGGAPISVLKQHIEQQARPLASPAWTRGFYEVIENWQQKGKVFSYKRYVKGLPP